MLFRSGRWVYKAGEWRSWKYYSFEYFLEQKQRRRISRAYQTGWDDEHSIERGKITNHFFNYLIYVPWAFPFICITLILGRNDLAFDVSGGSSAATKEIEMIKVARPKKSWFERVSKWCLVKITFASLARFEVLLTELLLIELQQRNFGWDLLSAVKEESKLIKICRSEVFFCRGCWPAAMTIQCWNHHQNVVLH